MKILVTDAQDQVGKALCRLLSAREIPVVGCSRESLDITQATQVAEQLAEHQPDYVVNCLSYPDIDAAETDSEVCYRLHRDGPGVLAQCCAERDIGLVQLSTDQVFDGTKTTAYSEADTPKPLNVYGRSLWEGEEAIRRIWDKHLILRTAWVFGPDGDNLLKRVLRQATEQDVVSVVSRQKGCPTPALDVARVILAMLEQVDCDVDPPLWGTYHYVGSDVTDWQTFAEAVLKAAKSFVDVEAEEVQTFDAMELGFTAARPANAELSTRKILSTFGIKQQPWRRGVQETLKSFYEPAVGAGEPVR